MCIRRTKRKIVLTRCQTFLHTFNKRLCPKISCLLIPTYVYSISVHCHRGRQLLDLIETIILSQAKCIIIGLSRICLCLCVCQLVRTKHELYGYWQNGMHIHCRGSLKLQALNIYYGVDSTQTWQDILSVPCLNIFKMLYCKLNSRCCIYGLL